MDSKPKAYYKDFAPQFVPDCNPEASITEYFLSKYEQRLSQNKPKWDCPPLSPAVQLVDACKDLEMAKRKLEEKLCEMKEKRKQMDKHWEELREKEQHLRESFVHFNKFVEENKEKRERAEKKIQEEKIVQEQREKEIVELQAKIDNFLRIKRALEVQVNKHRIYEDYMKRVLAETKEFATISDVLDRYETLTSAHKKLIQQQTMDLVTLENTQNRDVRLREGTSQIILGLNNRLAGLQSRYDQARGEAVHWETALSNITNGVAEIRLGIDQVKTSCWNLYQQTCHHQNRPLKLKKGNTEQQLLYIKWTIQELEKIVHVARQHTSKEVESNVATCATNQN